MEARLLSGIPMAEESALMQAPVRWDLGSGVDRIPMRVALFSLHRYMAFGRAVGAIRFRTAHGAEIPMRLWLELAATEPGAMLQVEEAIEAFRLATGALPESVTDLLMAVSDPVDPDGAWEILLRWSATAGLPWSREEGVDALRIALSIYCSHVLDVSSMMLLLSQLQQVMIEIKKKLLADQPTATTDEDGPWSKLRLRLRRRRESRRARSSTDGPS